MYFVDFKHREIVMETISCSDVNEPMWLHAGFDLLDYTGHEALEAVPALTRAIAALKDNPEYYRQYKEGYGGSLGTVLEFLEELREAAMEYGEDVYLDVRY